MTCDSPLLLFPSFSPPPAPLCYSLSFPSLSPHSLLAFLVYPSLLSSPLFVSPLFSSPVLSSPPPSVYPIWPSHLSWELSQGTRLLIQFLLNIMGLSSAFAIAATCRAEQNRKTRERETARHKNLNGSPPNNCRWTTNRNSNATFKKCHGCFNSVPFFSGGWTEYTYIVTQFWVFELSFQMLRHFQQIIEVTCSSCSPSMRHLRFENKIVQMSLKLGSKMYLMANNVEKEMHPRQ